MIHRTLRLIRQFALRWLAVTPLAVARQPMRSDARYYRAMQYANRRHG